MLKLNARVVIGPKQRLVVLVCLVAIIALLIFLTNRGETFYINVNEQGFSPSTVNLTQGDSVTFINNGKWEHWPASNIHPTHGIYPEFDPKKSLTPNQRWTFKFEKSGNFRFHDHILPTNTGSIEVKKNNSTLYALVVLAESLSSSLTKFQFQAAKVTYSLSPDLVDSQFKAADIFDLVQKDLPKLKQLIAAVGPQKVMDKLLSQSNGGTSLDCHQAAHQVGRLSYELLSRDAFKSANQSCHSGFMHGAMEAFLKDKGTTNLAQEITKLCSGEATSFSRFECLHGVGHGVMAYEDYNLPQALKICRSLKDDFAQSSCFGGMFMENIVVAEGNGARPNHSTKWVSDDPQFPCNAIDQGEDLQTQCYLMQTSRMLDIFKFNYEQVSAECLKAPKGMQGICFQSLGRDIAGGTLRDPQKINELCSKVPPSRNFDCMKGALFVIVDFWGENMTNQPHQLCRVQTNQTDKELCYQLIGGRLPGIFGKRSEKIKQVCSYSEKEFVSKCLSLIETG